MFGPETVAIMTVLGSFVSFVLARIKVAPSAVISAGVLFISGNNSLTRGKGIVISFFGVHVVNSSELHRLQAARTIATEIMLPSISSKALSIS